MEATSSADFSRGSLFFQLRFERFLLCVEESRS